MQKVLDRSGIRIGGVLSDVFGLNGRRILDGLVARRPRTEILNSLSRHVRSRLELLGDALRLTLCETDRLLLADLITGHDDLDRRVQDFDRHIDNALTDYTTQCRLLETIPGIDHTSACAILGEMGPDPSVFGAGSRLAAWAGLCPERGVRALTVLTRAQLRACAPTDSQEDPNLAVLVRQLTRYCESELSLCPPPALTRIKQRVAVYRTYLEQVRGFAPSTVTHHGRTAGELLAHIGYEEHPTRLAAVGRQDLDAFVRAVAPRQSRASLQHVVAHLRAFLRFLASAGEIPPGLDTQIDTPRVYRGEKLPRALPWDTVRALLETIVLLSFAVGDPAAPSVGCRCWRGVTGSCHRAMSWPA